MAAVAPQPRISGEGTPERDWQGWDGLRRVPRVYLRQVVPGAGRLVVVAPHPDDEVLAAGGLIAMLAQRNRPAWIVAVTDGGASHPRSVRWTPDQLARIRQRESAIGLRVLGLNEDRVLRLRIPDGQVGSHTATLVAALQALLLPADVVVSTWSGDGHPDHEATAIAAAEACASVRCTHLQAPVWMWHWASPGDERVPWGSLRRIELSPKMLARKRRAIDAHTTQLIPHEAGLPPILTVDMLKRLLRPSEYLFVPDVAIR